MSGVNAVLVRAVGSTISDDEQWGLLKFRRQSPDSQGREDFWVGVPVKLLPQLAVSAVAAIPKPKSGSDHYPMVFVAETVEFGLGGDEDQMVLTMSFAQGAQLSVQIDENQARSLALGLQSILGTSELAPLPPGTRAN